ASVKALIQALAGSCETGALIENLAGVHERFSELDATLRALLSEHGQFEFPEFRELLGELRKQTGILAELSPILSELVELPEPLSQALRRAELPLNEFE